MDSSILQYLHLSLDFLGLNSISGFEVGGYLDSMLNNTTTVYYVSIVSSFIIFAWAYLWKSEEEENSQESTKEESQEEAEMIEDDDEVSKISASFEISATDECEFVPLVSEEEDRRIAEEIAPKSQYKELDPDNPSAHFSMYLDMLHGNDEKDSDDDDDEVVVHDLKQREDFSKYVTEKDLHVLDDPRESPSRRGTVLSRVKKARQRAIRNAVEKDMTADDRLKEQMAANQMLSRVYTLMRENQEMFGETSFDQVKSQMDLYKA